MIIGIHALIHATDAAKTRAFFKDVLQLPSVDAGEGWLIFALPPAELGIHPEEAKTFHALSLICDNVEKTVAELRNKGVEFTQPVVDRGFGLVTTLRIPGGGEMNLYQPRHPMAIGLKSAAKKSRAARPTRRRKPTRKRK